MADPMRIRANMTGEKVEVKVLMAHEMETGLRKDAQGKIIPAHFIRNVTVTHSGKTVLSAQWGTSVSRNPFLHFRFKGGKPGEKVTIAWLDNQGEKRADEAVIAGG
jgi:sulfur-oxidizing protein SoxZ